MKFFITFYLGKKSLLLQYKIITYFIKKIFYGETRYVTIRSKIEKNWWYIKYCPLDWRARLASPTGRDMVRADKIPSNIDCGR